MAFCINQRGTLAASSSRSVADAHVIETLWTGDTI